jgi:hypothetical protein
MSYVPGKLQIGAKTGLGFSAVPATTYTPLSFLIGVTPPKSTITKVDASRFDSDVTPAGLPITDNIPGWFDPGEWSFKLQYDKAGTQVATVKAMQGVQHTWQVTYPDTKTRTFVGWIADFGEEVPMKEGMTLDVKIVINGGQDQVSA